MIYRIFFTKQALQDLEKVKQIPALLKKAKLLLQLLQTNPFQTPPPYEKLAGDLSGAYSRRLNVQHRLVYQIRENNVLGENTVVIIRMWTHYSGLGRQ